MLFFVWVMMLTSSGYHRIYAQDELPISGCPHNILRVIPFGQTNAVIAWPPPKSTDPRVQVSSAHSPPERFELGNTTVTYVFVKDGISSTCRFTIEIQQVDTTPPTVRGCPRKVSATIGYLEKMVSVKWTEPTASDNAETPIKMLKTHQPGDLFPRGFTVVTYTFTDESGNEYNCSFAVTVTLADITPPVISGCPSDIEIRVDNHEVFMPVKWTDPTATDESPSGIVELIRQSHSPGDSFRAGVTNVLYVFSDESQNKAVCTFQIHLRPPVLPNVHSCPHSVIAKVGDPEPEISEPEFITRDAVPRDNTRTDNKTYIRAERTNRNTIICSFEIYRFRDDKEPPSERSCTLRTPSTTATLGMGGARVKYTGSRVDYSIISHPSGSFFPIGETVVAYVLTDERGNIRVCSFSVTVLPAIRNCPRRTIYGHAKTDAEELQVYWPFPLVEPVVKAETLPPSHTAGSLFSLGSTEVSHSFADKSDSSAVLIESCVFSIDVKQTNPLSVRFCPADKNFTLPEDSSTVEVTWREPEPINDFGVAVPILQVDQSHESGTAFGLGNTTVVYQYIDSSEAKFTAECTFVVTVTDITDPIITGCNDRIELSAFLWQGTFDWESEIDVTDNSGDVTVTSIPDENYQYPLEETNFTLIATDSAGNEATCETVVVFSLFLSLPILIVIVVVIVLVLLVLLVCCCRCCCCRSSNKDDKSGLIVGNKTIPLNDVVPDRRISPASSDEVTPQGNEYSVNSQPPMPSAPSVTTLDNPPFNPTITLMYVEADTVQYTKDECPPIPPVARPMADPMREVRPMADPMREVPRGNSPHPPVISQGGPPPLPSRNESGTLQRSSKDPLSSTSDGDRPPLPPPMSEQEEHRPVPAARSGMTTLPRSGGSANLLPSILDLQRKVPTSSPNHTGRNTLPIQGTAKANVPTSTDGNDEYLQPIGSILSIGRKQGNIYPDLGMEAPSSGSGDGGSGLTEGYIYPGMAKKSDASRGGGTSPVPAQRNQPTYFEPI